ncbi:MAG TPA: alkaline phosphatase family protein, partial [Myxococcaceae bacterium]|nr:alkaline phosphatase family protein [Myxococcaceae bacterium]
ENRSFDHYFGTYKGVRGFADPAAIRQADGSSIFAQRTGAGDTRQLPFHLKTVGGQGECTNDIGHSWGTQHTSWDQGLMDRWMMAHIADDGPVDAPLTMGYYNREDLPFHYALADAFTVCDMFSCSVLGSTDSNRLMSISGTLDPDGTGGGPVLSTVGFQQRRSRNLRWTTYPEQLQAKGVSWKVYEGIDRGEETNPLNLFAQYQDPTKEIYRRAFAQAAWVNEVPVDFYADCLAGTLPQVSWLIAPDIYQEHPAFPPAWGEAALYQVMKALTVNPKVWAKSALVIAYDENGGFFDHVPPTTSPAGTAGEWVQGNPIGLGFRVPSLVVSPFSRNTATDGSALVCSDVFDHTSVLQLLERRFGAEIPGYTTSRPGLSAWRRAAVGDLTSAFNFAAPDRSVPRLPLVTTASPAVVECATNGSVTNTLGVPDPLPAYVPGAGGSVPAQEPGGVRRPSGVCSSPASRAAVANPAPRTAVHATRLGGPF